MALDGDSQSCWVSGGCPMQGWARVWPGDRGMCMCRGGCMHLSVCLSAVFIQAQQALVDSQRLLPAKTPPSLLRRGRGALQHLQWGDVPNVTVTQVPRLREEQELGGSGQRGKWRRSSGCRMGSAARTTPSPGAPRARRQCIGTPRLPHNSAAESGSCPRSRSSSTPKSHQV